MKLCIRFHGIADSEYDRQHIEDMLESSLGRFGKRLKKASIFFEDVNGPKGGVDKQCRCVLQLRRMPTIVITDQDENLTSLANRVANRAAYTLSQKTEQQSKRRQRGRERHREILADLYARWSAETKPPATDLTAAFSS